MRPRRPAPAVLLLLLLLSAGGITWWWKHPPDPVAAVRSRWSPLARLERAPAPGLGPSFERWTLVDARGDSVAALWRRAPSDVEAPWTVVLLGGLRTGDRAAQLVPDTIGAHVLALDWPWPTSRQPTAGDFVVHAGAIHATVLRSPALLALGAEAAARSGEAPPGRIALVGASLGVPPAMAALRLTEAPGALILLFGSAGLEGMLDRVLRRALGTGLLARAGTPVLAALSGRLIRPLEPMAHVDAARGVPILFVAAEEDELLPREGVEALAAALPHAHRIDLPGPHIRAHQRLRIEELSGRVGAWLDSLPDRRAPAVH